MAGRVQWQPPAIEAWYTRSTSAGVSTPRASFVARMRRPQASIAPVSCAVGCASAVRIGPSKSSVKAEMHTALAAVPPGMNCTKASGWPHAARIRSAACSQCESVPYPGACSLLVLMSASSISGAAPSE